jgi:hypothetical protein
MYHYTIISFNRGMCFVCFNHSPFIDRFVNTTFAFMDVPTGKGENCVQGLDGKGRRKETTWKTKA